MTLVGPLGDAVFVDGDDLAAGCHHLVLDDVFRPDAVLGRRAGHVHAPAQQISGHSYLRALSMNHGVVARGHEREDALPGGPGAQVEEAHAVLKKREDMQTYNDL